MKSIPLLLLCLYLTIEGQGQSAKISGKITYVAIIRNSLFITGAADKIDTTLLYFNDTASSYLLDTKAVLDNKKLAAIMQNMIGAADEKEEILTHIKSLSDKLRIQFDYHSNYSTAISSLFPIGEKNYCKIDTLEAFNWELFPDTMRILGFVCQKAVSKSIWIGGRLREFTAWYTPDIPVAYGPKSIFGLPGLVLKAESTYYNFTAVKIQIPLSPKDLTTLSPCKGLPRIGKKQAEELSRKLREDQLNMQKLRVNE